VAGQQESILKAWRDLDDYIDAMVDERRHTLSDDLLSDLIRAEEDGDRLSGDELRMLVAGLLMAGTDTTRNQLAAAVHTLCKHPAQWELLTMFPRLASNAAEELVRHTPVAVAMVRTALEDVELAGVRIPAGTLVVANLAAANRDPAKFVEPDRLDITRAGASALLTFGGGMHYCLGSHLARLEIAEGLAIMARRMPDIRLDGSAPWKPLTALSGPMTLPVAFDPT
jgi:cytochrome P450